MQVNGVDYHVETRGTGEALVLLHGFSGSGANWAAQVDVLAAQFRVITIDLPGHGRSEAPAEAQRYAVEPVARDLIAILDELGLPDLNLLGYSMGGRLALYTALAYPTRIRRLVLESASPGLRTAAEREARVASDEALATRIEVEGIEAFANTWTNLPLFATQPPDVRERLYAQRLNNNPVGLANSLRGMGTGTQPPLWERLGELNVPTLLLCGALDTKFAAINAEMQALMPRATLVTIDGVGHTIHAEQPERFRNEVVRFLAGDALK